MVSGEYNLSAESASYDKDTTNIRLDTNVVVNKRDAVLIQSESLNGNLKDESYTIAPFYMQDVQSGLWIDSKSSCINKDLFEFNNTLISSCDKEDPFWYFTFDEGEYDDNTTWVKMYNPTLYVGGLPVFYSPFLMFMANDNRRSGLLFPTIGYSSDEGFIYKQPLYLAPELDWDLLITPEIRTNRGQGIFTELRFADGEDSKGALRAGVFEDDSEYRSKYGLRNKKHHGLELDYQNESLLSNYFSDIKSDGLYIDAAMLNDIDYINLLSESDQFDLNDKIVTSRFNYYMQTEGNYLGLYGKHFYDTSLTTNESTLQELPTLHYHRYKESLFFDNLLYSIDAKATNYTRSKGLEAKKYEATIPAGFYFPLFDEYLTLGIFQELYFMNLHYGNEDDFGTNVDDANFAMNSYIFSLNSDLIKRYENFIHSMQIGLFYKDYSYKNRDGYYSDFIELPSDPKSTNIVLNNFLYDKNGELFLSNRSEQAIYFDDYDYKYGNLLNELKYYFSDTINVDHTTKYSHKYGRFVESQITLNYEVKDDYTIGVSHFFRDDNILDDASYFGLNLEKHYGTLDLFANSYYDFRDSRFRNWEVGFHKDKGCYEYGLSYFRDYVPVLGTAGSKPLKEDYIYFEVRLKPVGGVNYKLHRSDD